MLGKKNDGMGDTQTPPTPNGASVEYYCELGGLTPIFVSDCFLIQNACEELMAC